MPVDYQIHPDLQRVLHEAGIDFDLEGAGLRVRGHGNLLTMARAVWNQIRRERRPPPAPDFRPDPHRMAAAFGDDLVDGEDLEQDDDQVDDDDDAELYEGEPVTAEQAAAAEEVTSAARRDPGGSVCLQCRQTVERSTTTCPHCGGGAFLEVAP